MFLSCFYHVLSCFSWLKWSFPFCYPKNHPVIPVDHHFFMVDPMVVPTGDPLTETLSLDDEISR